MKTSIVTMICVSFVMTLNATVDERSLLGRPDYFWWPGSVENFLSVLEADATGATPPYHRRKYEDWKDVKDGTKVIGKKVVFERSDRVVVFLLSQKNDLGCELTLVTTRAYRPADYDEMERWEKNPKPGTPDFPTIP